MNDSDKPGVRPELPPVEAGRRSNPLAHVFDELVRFCRSRSLFMLHYCTGCGAIELPPAMTSRFDMERLGIQPMVSPRQADILLITGYVSLKTLKRIILTYEQMQGVGRYDPADEKGDDQNPDDNRDEGGQSPENILKTPNHFGFSPGTPLRNFATIPFINRMDQLSRYLSSGVSRVSSGFPLPDRSRGQASWE